MDDTTIDSYKQCKPYINLQINKQIHKIRQLIAQQRPSQHTTLDDTTIDSYKQCTPYINLPINKQIHKVRQLIALNGNSPQWYR